MDSAAAAPPLSSPVHPMQDQTTTATAPIPSPTVMIMPPPQLRALAYPPPAGYEARTTLRLRRQRETAEDGSVHMGYALSQIHCRLVAAPVTAPPPPPAAASSTSPAASPSPWADEEDELAADFLAESARQDEGEEEEDEQGDDDYEEEHTTKYSRAKRKRRRTWKADPYEYGEEEWETESLWEAAAEAAEAGEMPASVRSASSTPSRRGRGGRRSISAHGSNGRFTKSATKAALQAGRSSVLAFNLFLQRSSYPKQTLQELSVEEFKTLLPKWVLEARMLSGAPYLWTTLKGYMCSLQNVVRTFEPTEEWSTIVLRQLPNMAEAVMEVRAREHEQEKMKAMSQAQGGESDTLKQEMTTRRAQRMARDFIGGGGGEDESMQPPSQPPSAPPSPTFSARGGGMEDDLAGRGAPGLRPVPILTPEQEAYMRSQLDPLHPEGLFRLNFFTLAKYLGITFAEEHCSLTLRNLLRGKKMMKVRYEGGRQPRPAAPEQDAAATSADPPAESAVSAAVPHSLEEDVDMADANESAESRSSLADATPTVPAVPAVSPELPSDASAVSQTAAAESNASAATPAKESHPEEETQMDTTSPPMAADPSPAPSSNVNGVSNRGAVAAASPDSPSAAAVAAPFDSSTLPAPASAAAAVLSSPTVSSSSSPPFADDFTPFEVLDPSDPDPSACLREVRFLLFVPGALSRRKLAFVYERPWEGPLCPVRLYDAYLSHRPPLPSAGEPTEAPLENYYHLWLRLKKSHPPHDQCWFEPLLVGRKKLWAMVSSLAAGLGLEGGYINSSIAHTPCRSIELTEEEVEQLRKMNEEERYGIPTKEEQMERQRKAMKEAEEAARELARTATASATVQATSSASAARPSFTAAAPSVLPHAAPASRRKRQHVVPDEPAAASHSQTVLPSDPMWGSPQWQQMMQQIFGPQSASTDSFPAAMAAGWPGASPFPGAAPPRRVFYPSDPSTSAAAREQLLQSVDAANRSQAAVAQAAASSATATLPAPRPLPLPAFPPPTRLVPASLSSVPALLQSIDDLQSQLHRLTSFAADCQRSLTQMTAVTEHLKQESLNALKLQQQQQKIAQQYKTIEEQRFIIQRLQQKMGEQGMDDPVLRAFSNAAFPPTPAATAEEEEEEEEVEGAAAGEGVALAESAPASSAASEDDDESDLPPSAAPSSSTPQMEQTEPRREEEAPQSIIPAAETFSNTRFSDGPTRLIE